MSENVRREVIDGHEIVGRVERYAPGVKDILLCSPFITRNGLDPLLKIFKKKSRVELTVLSRYDDLEWASGVTDPAAFLELFELGKRKSWSVRVFLVDGLHAKAIVLGQRAAIIGSANVTHGGFASNFELGLVVKDSMVATTRKRLAALAAAGVELTPEALAAKVAFLEGPQGKRLQAMVNAVRRDRHPGPIAFTRDREQHFDYTLHLFQFLTHIGKSRTPIEKSKLIDWLDGMTTADHLKRSDQRLSLVESLGYIEEIPGGYRLHPQGRHLLQCESPKLLLYARLKALWREFHLMEECLIKWRHRKTPFTAETFSRIPELNHFHKGAKEKSVLEYWSQRLRWLKSVGVIEEVINKGRMQYRVVPEALTRAAEAQVHHLTPAPSDS